MAFNILFFPCIFLWNSNVSGNESSCQDVYAEIETLKNLLSELKTNQVSGMRYFKSVVKHQYSEMKYLKTVGKEQNSEIKELKKQMVMYRNNGNDSLDENVESK